ncbi:HlyD family secretion protein [Paraphotobacterium marinum]|uniref:HlyD family secretion protein n=1 Tax=Paraphotobacterium marinum TaxID=1755811 RepID=UPI0039E76A56
MNIKNKNPFIIVTIIFVSVGIIALLYWELWAKYYESTDDAYLKGNLTNISAQVSGVITNNYIIDNSFVKKGTLLATIDDQDYVANLKQAEANIAVSKATIKNYEAQFQMQNSEIEKSNSELDSAKAQEVYDQKNYDRIKVLVSKNFQSKNDLDSALSKLKTSQAKVNSGQATLSAAQKKLAVLDSSIKEQKAVLKAHESDLLKAKINYQRTKIFAPVDGFVAQRSIQKGTYVQNGSKLLTLVPSSDIWIEANFKETQIQNMKKGQKVEITFDAYPNLNFSGEVNSISPASGSEVALLPADNATGNFTKIVQRIPVKITLTNIQKNKARLIPGLSAYVTVDLR